MKKKAFIIIPSMVIFVLFIILIVKIGHKRSRSQHNKSELVKQSDDEIRQDEGESYEDITSEISDSETKEDITSDANNRVYLNVNNILQNPELPTGCEAVSATIVLNYYGINISKTDFVDSYLTYSTDPYLGFCGGTPYDEPDGSSLQWVAAGPIAESMNKAIKDLGYGYRADDITGTSFEEILKLVEEGHPVIYWALENMRSGNHTLVLIGYDCLEGICYFADPLKSGIQRYTYEASRQAFNKRGNQAVIINSNN